MDNTVVFVTKGGGDLIKAGDPLTEKGGRKSEMKKMGT